MHSHKSPIYTTEHRNSGAFLKALIQHLGSEQHRQLLAELAEANREDKCIRRAVFLMVVLLMFSVAGLGYCAILEPEVFRNPEHPLTQSLSVLGLGSLISQLLFLAYLLWHRLFAVTRLHREGRRLILALALSRLNASGASNFTSDVRGRTANASPTSSARRAEATPNESLSLEAIHCQP